MRTLLLIIFLIPSFISGNAQTGEDIRESFNEGEFFFVRGEYSEAAHYFRNVVESDPDNPHFNFRLGECYMNIPGSEFVAIPYFQKACVHTVIKSKYRSKSVDETNAPLHAWFYLGNVYRISGRLDDALRAYDTFVNSPFYYGNYNKNVVENEIRSCERAKIIMDSPVDVLMVALDTVINTTASELYPATDTSGNNMVFIRKLKFYDAIFYVSRQGETWSPPVNLNPLVGSDGDFYPVSLSPDGNELYLVKTSGLSRDIYVSYHRNSTWTKAEILNKRINSGADENWACVSADGQTLWFSSSRKGGFGGADLYFSRKDKSQQWGKAKNAGSVINTPFDEDSPCLTNHDQMLFFSSRGHYSMGGFDIFYTTKDGKTWTAPVNYGFPVNNTADNLGFAPSGSGKTGYLSRNNVTGEATSDDIFSIVFKSNYPLPSNAQK